MALSVGKAAFVSAVTAGTPSRVLEVGVGEGHTTRLLRGQVGKLIAVDIVEANVPDIVADIRALPFGACFDVVSADTLVNQLGSTLKQGLAELTRVARPTARLVIREWLPPSGDDSRDRQLRAMLAARRSDGDDYDMTKPDAIVDSLSHLGWSRSCVTVHVEPPDPSPARLYPLSEPRHRHLRPTPEPSSGPGVASSFVVTAWRGIE